VSNSTVQFKPGTSAFHIKGNSYRGYFKFFASICTAKLVDQLPTEDLRIFASQQFLPSSWYDFFPYVAICRAAARTTHEGYAEHIQRATRWQFKNDLNGIYRAILSVAGPRFVAGRVVQMTSSYFDFGHAQPLHSDANSFEAARFGMPHNMVEWYTHVSNAYLEEAVGAAGGKNPKSEVTGVDDEGESHGVAIKTVRFKVRWE